MKELESLTTYKFGISFNKEIKNKEISKHMKKNMNVIEYEQELNKLCHYCFENNRRVVYHKLRNFPYISHLDSFNKIADAAGMSTNYMESDFFFIRFIRNYTKIKDGKYSFPDVSYLINISKKVSYTDCKFEEIPIDVIMHN